MTQPINIETVTRSMSLANLIARMERRADWKPSTGEEVVWRMKRQLFPPTEIALYAKQPVDQIDVTPPTRASWVVYVNGHWLGKGKFTGHQAEARIEAFEEAPGQTTIEFWDGTNSDLAPVGRAFEELSLFILAGLPGEPEQPAVDGASASPIVRATANRKMKRQARVLELIQEMTVDEISEALEHEGFPHCSVATINRDLRNQNAVTPRPKKTK